MSQLIYELMPKIIGEIGAITKSHRNAAQNYSYRGIDDITAALDELLSKHGVFYVPTVKDFKREEKVTGKGALLTFTIVTVDYTFYASDGSCFIATSIGEGADSGDKACNKAMTSAQKTALLQCFNINSGNGDDSEKEHHEIVSSQIVSTPKAAAQRAEAKSIPNSGCPFCSAKDTLRPSKFGNGQNFFCSKNDGGCGKTVKAEERLVIDKSTGEVYTEEELPF